MFVNASKPSDKWIVFYENLETGEQHKCKREDYYQMIEAFEQTEQKQDWINYQIWEYNLR